DAAAARDTAAPLPAVRHGARRAAWRGAGCAAGLGDDVRADRAIARGRQRRPADPFAGLQPSARQRRREALRLRSDVSLRAALPAPGGCRDLPCRDADDEPPAERLSELQHAAGAGAGDRVNRLGRVQHGLQPHARSGAVRRRRDDRGAQPRRRRARRLLPLGRGAAAPGTAHGQRTARRVSVLHRAHERHCVARAVVGQHRAGRANPRRGAPRAPRRCPGRHRQPARGRRVPPCAERISAQAGAPAAALADDHRPDRPARPRRAADQRGGGAARRLRRGKPHLQPVGGLLPCRDTGRVDRASGDRVGRPPRRTGRAHPLRAHLGAPPRLRRAAGRRRRASRPGSPRRVARVIPPHRRRRRAQHPGTTGSLAGTV
ncbi:MAG: hypothetical protein AVDCRST_MAG67-3061, partial [uncultured Solirubrobacteraceae bacterium]